MRLAPLDAAILVAYLLLSGGIGLYYRRRAAGSLEDYFVSGRSLPWWVAGTSMVATTFAADTPLAVTGMVARHGVAGNWLWWNLAMSAMLTVFFYARLWRRAGVITDVEFTELRYAGRPAAVLRGFRALYLAIPINLIIMGWVNLAMVKILRVALGVEPWTAVILCFLVAGSYATFAGLWGVAITDLFQFVLAMAGALLLAVVAVGAVGGLGGLREGIAAHYGTADQGLSVLPPLDPVWMPPLTLAVYLGVQWWAAWYPGAEPGGGGYVAQRIFSARDEREGVLATLWFAIAHYALRPWPWILVGLASVILYPGLEDPESGYVRAVVDLLPSPLSGLMLAAFAAAYMSTISTHLNWGASYIVRDVYQRFLRPGATDGQLVRASRVATLLLMATSLLVTAALGTIEGAWRFLLAIGAGTGLVYILRWYWWRLNAWSEIAAMLASLAISLSLQVAGLEPDKPLEFARLMLATVAGATVVWLTVTYATPPEPETTLIDFYRRVRPGGPGWRRIARAAGFGADEIEAGWRSLGHWVLACASVYATLFALSAWTRGDAVTALALAAFAIAGVVVIVHGLRRT